VIKQRLLGLALALALLGTIGFAATANAADNETITVDASVADVLILTVNTSGFSFGSNLNFLGQNANHGSCANNDDPGDSGATYLSPNITTTVQSNRTYDVTRFATGTFEVGRIFVAQGAAFVDCATNDNTRIPLVMGPEIIVDNAPANASGQNTEVFSFDVRVPDPAASYNATVKYQAIAQ
jgi:hypothetical protein